MKTNGSPLVSIVMVTYNHSAYVSRAIQSCIEQTYPSVEIIIVDNNSTDGTREAIDELCNGLDNVTVVKLPNNTYPSYASNKGVKLAKGDYIALLSGDDFFANNKLETQLAYMSNHDAKVSFTWAELVDDDELLVTEHELDAVFNKELSSDEIKSHFVNSGNMLCATTSIIHRDVFEEYGFFDERLLQLQDYDFWIRISRELELHLITKKLSFYRVRNDNSNLSLSKDDSKYYRTEFEQFKIEHQFLSFRLATLSSIIGIECDENNKYKLLCDYLLSRGRYAAAMSVMDQCFVELTESVSHPSKIYEDFFELYSQTDFFRGQLLSESLRVEKLEQDIADANIEINRLRCIENSTTWKFIRPLLSTIGVVRVRVGHINHIVKIITNLGLKNSVLKALKLYRTGGFQGLVQRLSRFSIPLVSTKKDYLVNVSRTAIELFPKSILIVAELSIPQCTKYRVTQKKEMFESLGYSCKVVSWTDYITAKKEISLSSRVIFYRVPSNEIFAALINECQRLNVKTYWEVDDLIFNEQVLSDSRTIKGLDSNTQSQLLAGARRYKEAMLSCDEAIASTSGLASAMLNEGVKIAHVLENSLDRETLDSVSDICERPNQGEDSTVRIVYGSGTSTHNIDFEEAAPALARILKAHNNVVFRLIGLLELPECFDGLESQIERIELCEYSEYLRFVSECQISIAPLESYVFNESKSNIKFLEASIVGLPTVCSALSAFTDVVITGETGYVARNDNEWYESLSVLITDVRLRERIASNAHKLVLKRYEMESVAKHQLAPIVNEHLVINDTTRVVVFNVFYSPRSFGGATIVTEEVNKYLSKDEEVEVFVITTLPVDNEIKPYDFIRYEVDGVSVFGIGVPTHDMELYNNPNIHKPVSRILKGLNADIAHVHCIQGLGTGVLECCEQASLEYLVTVHDAWWLCERQFMVTQDGKFCGQTKIDEKKCSACLGKKSSHKIGRINASKKHLRSAKGILAPSTYSAELHNFNEVYHKPITVIENGVHFPKSITPRYKKNKISFGYVGGNTEIKGVDLVLDTFRKLNDEDIELVVVDNMLNLGHRSYPESALEGIECCSVVPAYDQGSIDDFFTSIDVLLFPSRCKESFGLTVREAISRNVWVISTDCGGPMDVITEGENGTVIPLDSGYQELLRAINKVIHVYRSRSCDAQFELPHNGIVSFETQAENIKSMYVSM